VGRGRVHDVEDFPGVQGLMSTQPRGNPKHAAYPAQILKLRRTQEFPRDCLYRRLYADLRDGHAGRAGAAKHPNRPDHHGHERTPEPQVGPGAGWSLDQPKLAYKDAVV
jgi:hypothetical protein